MLVDFREEVKASLDEALVSLGYGGADVGIETPPEGVDSDLASTVAFELADDDEVDGENPVEFAEEIAREVEIGGYDLVGNVFAEGPYVNFGVSDEYLRRTLESACDDVVAQLDDRDEKVVLEHTSANPTGPLHVGRARNPIIGDSLARILRSAGYDFDVEYYVNDMGRQVATIAWGLEEFDLEADDDLGEKPDHDVVRYYRRANEVLEAEDERAEEAEREVEELLQALEQCDEDALDRVGEAVDTCLEGQLESLERLGAEYDSFVRESSFVVDGDVDEVAESLKDDERCYKEGDAYKLDLTDFGVDKELVFLRSDGTSLYTTRDIAYHIDKFERCDTAVNVLGEDHKLQTRQLGAALEVLGEERKPENIFYSYVNLPEGKMSTREGNVVNIDDLLDEAVERARDEVEKRAEERDRDIENPDEVAENVGIGAVRFDVVARQPEKPITFRWEEALDFDGQRAPSIQYVHARASGILEKARDEGVEASVDVAALETEEERRLVRKVGELSRVVDEAADELAPHKVATYSRELAEAFNAFYRECHVLDAEDDVTRARLGLVLAARNAIAESLDLVGVETPEAM
ncbi:MAG: arginine--tRNA ligase [Halobacteria archaeon]|nr:arginine--tRNA ligase [Halobacteria archaeon]